VILTSGLPAEPLVFLRLEGAMSIFERLEFEVFLVKGNGHSSTNQHLAVFYIFKLSVVPLSN
jgi:hypothetical protein